MKLSNTCFCVTLYNFSLSFVKVRKICFTRKDDVTVQEEQCVTNEGDNVSDLFETIVSSISVLQLTLFNRRFHKISEWKGWKLTLQHYFRTLEFYTQYIKISSVKQEITVQITKDFYYIPLAVHDSLHPRNVVLKPWPLKNERILSCCNSCSVPRIPSVVQHLICNYLNC